MVTRVARIPSAPITPIPEMSFISATNRQPRPSATVDPDARITGPTPFSAARIAAWTSLWRRSCSRYRATISSASSVPAPNTITIMIDELCVLTVRSSAPATTRTSAIDTYTAAPTVSSGTSQRNGLR